MSLQLLWWKMESFSNDFWYGRMSYARFSKLIAGIDVYGESGKSKKVDMMVVSF